jgi:Xaa-Pro aminopeptidase
VRPPGEHAGGAFAPGPGRADYEARPNLIALRAERLARVQCALRDSGLDALLVWKDENVRYLTGLRAQIISGKSALLNGALLQPDGPPALLCSGGERDRVRAVMPWIEDVRPVPIMEAAGLVVGAVESTIAPLLRERGLDDSVVGIDECAIAQLQALDRVLPRLHVEDGDALMQRCRRRKSPGELAVMEEAAAIAEGVTEAVLAAVRPGVRECEIAGEALRVLHRLGGEMAHLATPFVASDERMSPPNRLATDKLVREGDLVFVDIGAMWGGYFSDLGRTTVCGTPVRSSDASTVPCTTPCAPARRRCGREPLPATSRRRRSPRRRSTASPTGSSVCSSATGSAWEPTSRPTSESGCRVPRRSSSRRG